MKSLVDEFAPLFPDTNKWHLGADEYVHPFKTADGKYPETTQRVKEKLGEDKRFVDGFVTFINEMADYLKTKHNKTDIRVWNDAFYLSDSQQTVELDKGITIDYWTKWSAAMAPVKTFVDKGHKLINYNDAYMYWVLARPGKAYFDKPSADKIFNGFHAGRFANISKFEVKLGQVNKSNVVRLPTTQSGCGVRHLPSGPMLPKCLLKMKSQKDKAPYTAFADRVWYSGDERSFEQFKAAMKAVGDSPVVPADLDKLVISTQSTLESVPASGESVNPGQGVTYTASVKNTSSMTVPVTVAT